jgi:hypothetical protein
MERCLCLCDDDNDLEMALSCFHTFVPIVTSVSMDNAIQSHPGKFTVTSLLGGDGMDATEKALTLVLEQIMSYRYK